MLCSVQGAVLPDDQPCAPVHAVGPRGARGAAPVQGVPHPHGRSCPGGTRPACPRVNPEGSPCKTTCLLQHHRHTIPSCRSLKLCLWMWAQVKARGLPDAEDVSIAAHLLRLRDPATGQTLPDDLLAGEFGLFFSAGIESAGNAISWTL